MTARVVTFGISKGGCSKSTSSGLTAYLLSKQGERVLTVDMDSQGNLTSLLTGEFDVCNAFENRTVKEAIINRDARPYILNVMDNLDIIPANDYLATLSRALYEQAIRSRRKVDFMTFLGDALEPVMENYDWIIIDTPPALSEQTIMPLNVRSKKGSYAIIMFDGSMFAYYAIPKFIEIIEGSKNRYNPDLNTAGILFSLIDYRAKENEIMLKKVNENFPSLTFDTIVRRKATTRRISMQGFDHNAELIDAIEYYIPFVKELKAYVRKQERNREQVDE